MKRSMFLFLLGAFFLVSCGLLPEPDVLDGTEWNLLYIRKSVPITSSRITIEFEDGELRGSAGCNSYFGEYDLQGSKIVFGPIAITEMACMQPEGVMKQELEYLDFLSEVVSFTITEDQLILRKEQQDQLTFER